MLEGTQKSLEIVPGQGRGCERIAIDTANSLFLVHLETSVQDYLQINC